MTGTFSMIDTMARAKVAFDGADYGTAARLLNLAADYADKMEALQEDMNLLADELQDRINKDQSE